MSNYVKLLNNLKELSLNNIKLNFHKYIEMINDPEKSLIDALYILFVGTSEVGKTHLATSIGIKSATNTYSTQFIHFQELIQQFKKALTKNKLDTRLKHFSKYKFLIIDEIGYLPIDTDAANLFFIQNRLQFIFYTHMASFFLYKHIILINLNLFQLYKNTKKHA